MPKTKASQTYANISLALSWLAHYWCSLRRSYIAALYATLASAALSLKCAHHTHYAECMHDWNAIFGHMGGLHKRVIWWAGGVQGLLLYWKLQSNQDFKQRRNGGFIKIRTFPRCNSSFLKGSFSRVFLHFFSFLCPCPCLFEYLWLCLMKGSCPDVRCCTHRTPTKISNLRLSLSCYIYTLRQIAWHCMIQYFMHWHCRSDPEWLMWHWNDWKFVYIAEMQSFW